MSQNNPFTIALAGNPNVGKSTIFNALTKMHQHTGNWPGKTVACASGMFRYRSASCLVVDLPGTYSLRTHSEEEEIAREYIASGQSDLLLVVCDATCLERGLRLLKQIRDLEKACPKHVILCVNLCDEAAKKGIVLDFECLSEKLGIPAIPCTARSRGGLEKLKEKIYEIYQLNKIQTPEITEGLSEGNSDVHDIMPGGCGTLCCLGSCCQMEEACAELCPHHCAASRQLILSCQSCIADFSPELLAVQVVSYRNPAYLKRQERIDRIVTGPYTSGIIMIVLLMAVFWITITGANYPSSFLWDQFFRLETWLAAHMAAAGVPAWFINSMVYGVYRVVAWVVSVMLPPMAIFFPLFTLLEDLGYLPRAAFNMDCAFKKCKACGKQCLTMCLGITLRRPLALEFSNMSPSTFQKYSF